MCRVESGLTGNQIYKETIMSWGIVSGICQKVPEMPKVCPSITFLFWEVCEGDAYIRDSWKENEPSLSVDLIAKTPVQSTLQVSLCPSLNPSVHCSVTYNS